MMVVVTVGKIVVNAWDIYWSHNHTRLGYFVLACLLISLCATGYVMKHMNSRSRRRDEFVHHIQYISV